MSRNAHADLTNLVDSLKRFQAGHKEAGIEILRTEEIQRIIGRECAKWIPEYELKELQQICYQIILRILTKFNLPEDSQGGHIIAYLNKFLKFRLIDAIEKMKKESLEVSLDAPYSDDGMTLAEIIPDPNSMDMEDRIALKVDLENAMKYLTPTQRQAIEMSFYKGMTHEEIAATLNVTRPAVTLSIQSALRKLKILLVEE